MRSQLKIDPTRTITLRKQFIRDMNRRFKALAKAVRQLIDVDDVFGLKEKTPFQILVEKRAWTFLNNPQKLTQFETWFQQQTNAGILETAKTPPWTSKYVESAYKKGMVRAYTDTHQLSGKTSSFYQGTKAEFLRSAFAAPETVDKLKLLYTRTYSQLKGVNASMDQQMSRILADGLAHGKSAAAIAKAMTDGIGSINRRRARVIARTEIINAHAEGQLDSFERLGLKEVGVMAEWLTAGDPCELCATLEGVVMPIHEARGLIPRHPNCLHPNTLVTPGGFITGVSKRWYDGVMFIIETSFGDKITCTPNHPILTDSGFVPANSFNIGSKIVCNSVSEREGLTNRNNIYKPTRIEDVAKAFLKKSNVISIPVPTSPEDFHGDGIGSKIAVISTDSFLRNSFNAPLKKHFFKLDFIFRNIRRILLNCFGMFAFGFPRNCLASPGNVGSFHLFGLSKIAHLRPFKRFSFTLCPKFNLGILKSLINRSTTNTILLSKFINRISRFVKLYDFIYRQREHKCLRNLFSRIGTDYSFGYVTHVKSFRYVGYVYNLETTELYYIANNIASHNCRCLWIPANVGEKDKGQKWGKEKNNAIADSIKKEGGLAKSTWTFKAKATRAVRKVKK